MPVGISIARKRGKAKIKVIQKREATEEMLREFKAEDLDVRVSLIQELIPLGLRAVGEELQREFKELVGERYKRGKGNTAWGKNPGSVYLQDQKVPIKVPRVRDREKNTEISLEAYQKFQKPYLCDNKTMLKLLNGISTHKYRESAELVPEVFGISASNISKRFKYVTQEKLRRLKHRSLYEQDIICIFIDGKRYGEDGLIVVLGITMEGRKIILDIEQTHTETGVVIEQILENLIERGLRYKEGLLFIADGSRGIINGIRRKFQEYGFIQRCIWHKEQNVVGYLSQKQGELCKMVLKRAYKSTSYEEAKEELEKLYNELAITNESAANSLIEGIEETLTLHRLGLSPELSKSLNNTNCLESIMSQLGQYTDKVDRWRNSNQLLRWNASALFEIEPRLKKIRGYRYLNVLRFKMQEEIKKRQEEKYGHAELVLASNT